MKSESCLGHLLASQLKAERTTHDRCNKPVNAIKQMKIIKAPPVLSLHLKRFTPFGKKINTLVDFRDNLTLTNAIIEGPSIEYELYGVTLHYGSGPNNGHYISIVKNADKKWYKMDDSDVTSQMSLSPSDKKNTYQLHYIRKAGTKLNDILGVKSPKAGRTDLSRSYGAGEEDVGSKETPSRQDSPPRGLKRQREEEAASPRHVVNMSPLQLLAQQSLSKKQRAEKSVFTPMKSSAFYGDAESEPTPPRPLTPAQSAGDEHSEDYEDESDEDSTRPGASPRSIKDRSWLGKSTTEKDRQLSNSAASLLALKSSFGGGDNSSSTNNSPRRGKKQNRRKHKATSSPFLQSHSASGKNGAGLMKKRGHGAMKKKDWRP